MAKSSTQRVQEHRARKRAAEGKLPQARLKEPEKKLITFEKEQLR